MPTAEAHNPSMPVVEAPPAPPKNPGGRRPLPEAERRNQLLQSTVTKRERDALKVFCQRKGWSESKAVSEIVSDRLIAERLLKPKPKKR